MRLGPLSLLPIALVAAAAGPTAASLDQPSPLQGLHERWLAGVSHRMSDAERRAFLALDDDAERELFARRFWAAREPGTPLAEVPLAEVPLAEVPLAENRSLALWRQAFEAASELDADLDDERARAMLVAGRPASVTVLLGCRDVIRFLEVWSYEPWHVERRGVGSDDGADGGFHLLFYRRSNLDEDSYRHWSPADGTGALMYGDPEPPWSSAALAELAAEERCLERPGDASVLQAAIEGALSPAELRLRLVPPHPGDGWLESFAAELAASPAEELLPARLALDYPGRYQRKTILRGRVKIPTEELDRNRRGQLFDRLVISGHVRREDRRGDRRRGDRRRLVDVFEVIHHLAGAPPTEGVELDFYRRLRPGVYTLEVRAADDLGVTLLRASRRLEVPELEAEATPPAGRKNGFGGLTRTEVGVLTTFPAVELRSPADHLPVGQVELEAVTVGGPIDRLEFRFDGALAGTDAEPPYTVTVDLGEEPRRHLVEAVAVDEAGLELARDRLELGATPPRRFAVRLLEPVLGRPARRVRARVEVPPEARLDRLELHLGDRLLATLRDPPFTHPLDGAAVPGGRPRYLRAIAHLDDGRTAEDVTLLVAPGLVEEVDVRLVELYASVVDGAGHPVTGLAAEDFRVREDGTVQPIRRFDTPLRLAINVTLLMDVSGSMRGRVRLASKSARRFFDTVLTPRDLASLVVFNHDVRRAVPFTADVATLRHGAGGFRAWGTTRLHDALIYALHGFAGLEGKRALVLLSDGQDVDSDYRFKQVREAAIRSGVALYPIMLALDHEETRNQLRKLAEVTGGRYFSIQSVNELDDVYRQIEEDLRAQYLLVYEAPPGGGELRRVSVEVLREGLRARTLRGYYP